VTRKHRPLRVAFDHRIFAYQKFGGVSRYFARLVEHLPDFGVESKIISPLYLTEYLKDLPKGSVWGRQVAPSDKAVRRGFVLGEILYKPLALAYGADIVHETYHHPRNLAPERSRIVITIYDMIHERLPPSDANEALKRDIALGVKRADKVICISESTRRDLLHVHPEIAAKTEVVLLGFDPVETTRSAAALHGKPYLLYVGMRWRGYKNFEGLLSAYGSSELLKSQFDLVCVGGGEFSAEERRKIDAAGVADKVFQYAADDAALRSFYRHAHLFVYPSLYEGFGIPPLEAMAADCPVVCMHVSSMPEVCGDAVEYAFPDQPESLRSAIERVALSTERAEALRAAGRDRLKLFSWRECARQTSEIYKGVV
jgi:glycosyltransferase involved in cell wall biosynthesis